MAQYAVFSSIGIRVPDDWHKLKIPDLKGLVMLLGGPDTGKSTLARYLYTCMVESGCTVAYLDGDPGQSSLGPPTTISIMCKQYDGTKDHPERSMDTDIYRCFIGSTTPRGHMLAMLVGANKLMHIAHRYNIETIVYDSCGFIEPLQGGVNLKLAKVDLLRPQSILAIQKQAELEPLLIPLRRMYGNRLVELPPSPAVTIRSPEVRRAYRTEQFIRYFQNAGTLTIDWDRYAILPLPQFMLHRLIAFMNRDGFLIDLGIITEINRRAHLLLVLTPMKTVAGISSIHLGDLLVDPQSFQDSILKSF